MWHIWTIDDWEKNIDLTREGHRTGLRLRFDKDIDSEVRRACKEFAVFLRREYFFQWINALKLTPIGQERQATNYARYILDEYAETREHPSGEEDSDSCPKIIIESFIKDISGHIVLNASCQLQSIEENAKCNYNCKFPIKTEMGLLYNFAKQLPKLNEQEVGIFVELL